MLTRVHTYTHTHLHTCISTALLWLCSCVPQLVVAHIAFLPLWLWHTLRFYRFAPYISYVRHALWTCVPCTLHACDLTPTHVCHNQFVPHVCSGWYSFNQNGITHVKNTATAVGFLYLFYFPLRNYYDVLESSYWNHHNSCEEDVLGNRLMMYWVIDL